MAQPSRTTRNELGFAESFFRIGPDVSLLNPIVKEQPRNNFLISIVAEERELSGSSIPDGSRRSAN